MDIRRFPNAAEAERFLREQGFQFVGAPNRWRKAEEHRIHYAEITGSAGQAVLVITTVESQNP
ncbi:MAG TPA: hypothetical protein VGC80_07570 [Acetobacteraceae bacterium]